jgi:hypothetical protein
MGFKKLAFFLFLIVLISGCIPDYRIHPEFEMLAKNIKTLGLVTPDIKIYKLTAGGIRELDDDWSSKGRQNVLDILLKLSKGTRIKIKPIEVDPEIEEEMEDIKSLYMAVNKSILLHTYNFPIEEINEPLDYPREDNKFSDKIKNFVYSIGSVEKITQKYGVDGLMFIYGMDEISTKGRKMLKIAGSILESITKVELMSPSLRRGGITVLTMAIVDPNGNIIWYDAEIKEGIYDLRDPDSTYQILAKIFWQLQWSMY